VVSQLQVKKITLLKLKEMIFGRKGEQDSQLRQELLRSVPSKQQDAGDEGRRPKRSLIT